MEQSIDSGMEDGELTSAEGAALIYKIRLFSLTFEHDILAGKVSDHNHFNIVKSLATSITSLNEGLKTSSLPVALLRRPWRPASVRTNSVTRAHPHPRDRTEKIHECGQDREEANRRDTSSRSI
jgi:hypothetical protein